MHEFLYSPIKFAWLIQQVEAAQTVQQEHRAFERAARWGHVWELNLVLHREAWPERWREHAKDLEGTELLELEWLESSPWSGKPHRAYRVLLSEENLETLRRTVGKQSVRGRL